MTGMAVICLLQNCDNDLLKIAAETDGLQPSL